MNNINLVDVDLNRDIQEISNYIQSYIDATYLSQVRNQIKTRKKQYDEATFPEVQLLDALVPFVPEEFKGGFTNLIEMITYSKMIENMLPSYGVEKLFVRNEYEDKGPSDYIHQAVLVLVLYKVIVWAEKSD